MGKAGAVILGAGVPVGSAAFAFMDTQAKAKNASMGGKVVFGIVNWMNQMAGAFGFEEPFKGGLELPGQTPGSTVIVSPTSSISKGWGWGVVGTGAIALFADRAAGWLANRKSGFKAFGVNVLGGK